MLQYKFGVYTFICGSQDAAVTIWLVFLTKKIFAKGKRAALSHRTIVVGRVCVSAVV